jgi:hypothetical protein
MATVAMVDYQLHPHQVGSDVLGLKDGVMDWWVDQKPPKSDGQVCQTVGGDRVRKDEVGMMWVDCRNAVVHSKWDGKLLLGGADVLVRRPVVGEQPELSDRSDAFVV